MPPRPQSSSYPKFDPEIATPASEQAASRGSMQNLRGVFLSREERDRLGLAGGTGGSGSGSGSGKRGGGEEEKEKKPAGGTMRSASMPGPLKSAMKAPSRAGSTATMERISNSDPLPEDREALTGLLNHASSQLQKLADRAEKVNEWIDLDLIVLARLTADAKATAEKSSSPTSTKPPSIRVTGAGSNSSAASDAPVTDAIVELNDRVRVMQRWLKDLERAVFWQREEYRRIEKAMGRRKSGQSGSIPLPRNVGFENQEQGKEKAQGEGEKADMVDTLENWAKLAELDAMVRGGMKLGGEEPEVGFESQSEGQGVLRQRDYARDRWSSSLSRLPNQPEWEEMFGKKALQKK